MYEIMLLCNDPETLALVGKRRYKRTLFQGTSGSRICIVNSSEVITVVASWTVRGRGNLFDLHSGSPVSCHNVNLLRFLQDILLNHTYVSTHTFTHQTFFPYTFQLYVSITKAERFTNPRSAQTLVITDFFGVGGLTLLYPHTGA